MSRDPRLDQLIERSSLGTPGAKSIRRRVPEDVVDRVPSAHQAGKKVRPTTVAPPDVTAPWHATWFTDDLAVGGSQTLKDQDEVAHWMLRRYPLREFLERHDLPAQPEAVEKIISDVLLDLFIKRSNHVKMP